MDHALSAGGNGCPLERQFGHYFSLALLFGSVIVQSQRVMQQWILKLQHGLTDCGCCGWLC